MTSNDELTKEVLVIEDNDDDLNVKDDDCPDSENGERVVNDDDCLDSDQDNGRVVLSNNFLMPLEPVDMPCNATATRTEPKKHKEKKNGRFYKFVKRHFLHRKHNNNDVREIHIVPEGEERKWARRSAGSAASRSSDETTSSEGDRLEVVHDMAEEYISD